VFARFRAFAVFETLTTAALFLVDMPARYGLGVALDGGIGLFGWVHGAAVLGYLAITLANHRTLGGTPRNTALQVAAGVVPFASLWVLHRTARSTSGTASST
jgi:integral membrane protein